MTSDRITNNEGEIEKITKNLCKKLIDFYSTNFMSSQKLADL